ncbi:MAG: ABC transporter, partial [Actinomyces sp.]
MNHDGSAADHDTSGPRGLDASLTSTVLAEEAARREAAERAGQPVLFADELLPGVGSEPMSFAEGLKKGGAFTFLVLLVLNSLDELEGAAMNVLAPDIRDTFG